MPIRRAFPIPFSSSIPFFLTSIDLYKFLHLFIPTPNPNHVLILGISLTAIPKGCAAALHQSLGHILKKIAGAAMALLSRVTVMEDPSPVMLA